MTLRDRWATWYRALGDHLARWSESGSSRTLQFTSRMGNQVGEVDPYGLRRQLSEATADYSTVGSLGAHVRVPDLLPTPTGPADDDPASQR